MRSRQSVAVLVIALNMATGTVAAGSCDDVVGEIDVRLAKYDYSARQVQQAQQMKQQMNFACQQSAMPPQMVDQMVAQMATTIDDMLPIPAEDSSATANLPMTELTNAYLQGDWCRSGQEATSYQFRPDGTYRIWVVGWGSQTADEIHPKVEFTDRFDYLNVREDDRFVAVRQSGSAKPTETTFTRGECGFMSAPGYAG